MFRVIFFCVFALLLFVSGSILGNLIDINDSDLT